MSVRIEWARASDQMRFVNAAEAADINDAYGSSVDHGNSALTIGGGIVVEGTPAQLREWLLHGLEQVSDNAWRPDGASA